MRLAHMTAALALAGAMGTAQASVVYNWQPISASGVTINSGQLIFSDRAYRAGSASFDQASNYDDPLTTNIYPNSPIIHTSLSFSATDTPDVSLAINPRLGKGSNPQSYSLTGDFLFSGDLLTGAYNALTYESQYAMSSDADGLWSVSDVNSDVFFGADGCSDFNANFSCGTATGRWIIDSSTVAAVPEPSSWAVLMLAALGTLLLAWRRPTA